MKNILPTFVFIFLFCQCKDASTNLKGNNHSTLAKINLQLSDATEKDYKALAEKERIQRPIGRLCAESKGYRTDEWDALNECSWAVEKHQLNLYPTIANRSGGQLNLTLVDSTITLTHQADEYYQFVDYLAEQHYTVVRILRPSSCPKYWLIHMKNGNRTILDGRPVFQNDNNRFLLSKSSSSTKIKCPSEVELWAFHGGAFQQSGQLKNTLAIEDLMLANDNSWLGLSNGQVVRIGF